MERTEKVSDQGKGQASSPHKPADFIRRAAKTAEQSHRGNKPRVEQKSISSQERTPNPKEARSKPRVEQKSISSKGSTSNPKEARSKPRVEQKSISSKERTPNPKEARSKPRVEQKSISSKGSTSNPKEARSKLQKDRTSRLHERSFEARQFSQMPRNAGQERRRLRGGGDDDTTTQQQSDLTAKQAEVTKNPMEQAADYLRGLTKDDYNAFNAHKHGFHNERGAEITNEHKRILQQPFD